MKTAKFFLILFMLFPVISFAGEIYGTIKAGDGKPLANQVVQIKQNDMVLASDTTDANGYFTVKIKEVGKLKLEVAGYTGATFDVFSSNNSIRYNLSMIKSDGKWILKSL
jgi:hypothetical protein